MSARSRYALPALLALTVLAVTIAPLPAVVGDASAAQTTETSTDSFPTETTITIQLQPDGDARWTITTRFATSDDADREAFRELATQYENGERETPWLDTVRASKDAAETATGRSMNVTDVRRSSNVDNTSLSLQLTWSDFARQEGDQFVADDVFNTTRGTWLDGLTEHQQLLIELPPGATLQHAPQGAAIQRGHIRWDGPQQFEPGYMRVAYTVDEDPTTTTAPGSNANLFWGGFFVLGIGVIAVGVYVLSRRHGGVPGRPTGSGDGPGSPPAGQSSGTPVGDPSTRSATTGTVEPAVTEPADEIDEELLSDEERVERLLERNGGRMKQANIVKETGWSNAKVSQLLSAMDEDGRIDKLRIGRENLISFPDEDVTDIDEE